MGEAVNAALGRVFASVPESTVMDVYNSVSSITDSGVPAYLKSTVNGAECRCQGVLRVQGRGEGSPLSRAPPRAEAEELPAQNTSRGVCMHIVFSICALLSKTPTANHRRGGG